MLLKTLKKFQIEMHSQLIELCDCLTGIWEHMESSVIDSPKCLTGIVMFMREMSVTIESD